MTDKLREALERIIALDVPVNIVDVMDSTAREAVEIAKAALAQQDAQAVPVAWMSKMDFEALKSRGRVTTTLYGEPVGNKTNEVELCLATPTPPSRRNNHD